MAFTQERIQKFYQSIQLPQVFVEQDRGFRRCCIPLLVLAGGSKTWENDITSAWIKVSDPLDTFSFELQKDGVPVTNYIVEVEEFPNEDNAYYTTIRWADVLPLEGVGCFTLNIVYDISGIQGSIVWGQYNLQAWSVENALGSARLRVFFNLNQEIEGINFTGANVEDSIRFRGFIGERQPNTETDNLIYNNRLEKSVVRENLNSYIITTDPYSAEVLDLLTDLYLLSENELFISDYNAHNPSYRINDIPQIVEESPEIDYLDKFSRDAVLTCKTGDKKKNKRTFY